MDHPADVSGLAGLFDSGAVRPEEVVAILGKTEGNGCVNDFTRGYATASLRALLVERGLTPDQARRTPMVMSGGVEGGLSPHFLVFAARPADVAGGEPALAIGVAHTRLFDPSEIGRMAQVRETAEAVRQAIAGARIESADDVHLVQIKCPLLTQQKLNQAYGAGREASTEDTYASMGFSRGASALGVALGLGEIEEAELSDAAVCREFELWSGRASASAGSELDHSEIIVFGNSRAWAGPDRIHHAVMRDGIDVGAVHDVLGALGFAPRSQLDEADRGRIKAVIAKAEPSRDGRIRNARHIMWDDSDINPTRHARALVGGVLAGVLGCTDLFVSGGSEHQGPDGGGPIAIIASRES
jgi:cyanuric acid amidohydrolase